MFFMGTKLLLYTMFFFFFFRCIFFKVRGIVVLDVFGVFWPCLLMLFITCFLLSKTGSMA